MRLFAAVLSTFAGLAWLCASDVTDKRPPFDASLLVSFDRGDASDRSWLAQTPTVGAGVTFPATYRVADFDGTSSASVTYPDLANFETAPFSVVFWARIDSITTRVSLVAKNTSTAAPVLYRGWYIHYIGTSAGSYGMVITTNTDASNYISKYTGSPSTYNDGSWRHFVFVVDSASVGTNWKVYVNGTSASLSTLSAGTVGTLANSEPFTLAGFTTANQTARLNGALDDVRIYNTVLTADQIGQIYAETVGDSRP